MRLLPTAACLAVLGFCAFLAGSPKDADLKLRLRLVDAETGKAVGGMVRIKDGASGDLIKPTGLLDRLRGFAVPKSCVGWHVVPVDGGETTLPRRRLRLEALHGLETALVRQELDLGKAPAQEITIQLPFLFRPDRLGLVAGNTHLHLLNMTRAEADAYLRTIPAADGLKVLAQQVAPSFLLRKAARRSRSLRCSKKRIDFYQLRRNHGTNGPQGMAAPTILADHRGAARRRVVRSAWRGRRTTPGHNSARDRW